MNLGIFSVSYAGLWGQTKLDLFSFLDKAADLGFEGVLLMAKRPHLSPLDVTPELLEQLTAKLEARHLKLIGLAAYNDFLMGGAAEVPIREMQIAYIESCAKITAALGGQLVRVFTGYERRDLALSSQWDMIIETLRECADRVARYGIKLSVQNHHDLAVDTAAFDLLLTEISRPNIVANYDAWSPFLRGEPLFDGAKTLAPKTAMTIVADYIRLRRFNYQPSLVNYTKTEPDFVRATMLGKGEIDYQSFFKGLQDGGFSGWAVYEMCSPVIGGPALENLDRHAVGFINYMKQV